MSKTTILFCGVGNHSTSLSENILNKKTEGIHQQARWMRMDYTSLFLSLKIAGIATVFVFLAGVILARLFARNTFPGKRIIEAFLLLPLVLPPTVVGFGLLYLFGKNGPVGSLLLHW